jgi:hypothetical protein
VSLALPARFITELAASVDHYWHRAWGMEEHCEFRIAECEFR